MKKIIVLTLALAAILVFAASCTSGGTTPETSKVPDTANAPDTTAKAAEKLTDVNAIAAALVAAGDFEGELEQVQGVEYVYSDLPAGVEAAVYQSTAYSDEVAVFKGDAAALKTVVETHVTERVATFKDYAPAQSTKADENAAIVVSGDIVVLVVSNASAADAKALIEKMVG